MENLASNTKNNIRENCYLRFTKRMVKFYGRKDINNYSKIIILLKHIFKKDPCFYTKDYLQHWGERVKVGDFTYGKPRIYYLGENAKLEIGKFCSFADNIIIFLGGNHRYDWTTTYPFSALNNYWPEASSITGHPATKGNVVIGNDVWIGYGAIILSGVTIGDGAVIGASAVVSKDINPYSIVIGNPAREIKRRFSDEMIDTLLQIRWWDWPIDKIKNNMEDLCSNPIKLINRT